ncbi:hypothetical protein LX87_05675 [Larkinella arboricola]|uniref:Relaxase/mobilization nuclease-like protein n=1 Tax=Larkinella arboricola TaxID=643671 RepID=A0A327WJ80_LARAB|nr:DUF5712 family protein [Larkinella arboricola]RAJ89776.1 hypothetical protein LX87_05675 [Larkinella arboricola]
MMTKIPAGGSGLSNRSGSCGGLVTYLEKEQQGQWFGREADGVAGGQVVADIDANKRNLGRTDDKYYQIVLAPSQAELAHLKANPEALKAFTREAMEQYAENFGKGIKSQDLVWYAKIEQHRSYTYTDRAVQLGEQPKGLAKQGDQTHIHVIVSRTENLKAYRQGLEAGLHQRKNPYHLSPLTNHKATTKGVVQGGFERNAFSQRVEQSFDRSFGYQRSLTESFAYRHGMKYGDEALKAELGQAARLEAAPRPTAELTVADPLAGLREGLGQAYQQQEAHRQAELQRQQEAAQGLKQQQAIEIKPDETPRRSRGLGL